LYRIDRPLSKFTTSRRSAISRVQILTLALTLKIQAGVKIVPLTDGNWSLAASLAAAAAEVCWTGTR